MQPANREELRLVVAHVNSGDSLTIIGAGTYPVPDGESEGGGEGGQQVGSYFPAGPYDCRGIRASCQVAAAARDAGLGGFEFSSGIPGTLAGPW